MTPERWQQIRAVFEEAESLQGAARAQFLETACAADEELREEVDSLLNAAERAGASFLGTPAANLLQPEAAGEAAASRIGRRIGPYQILAEIGHGGMGEVYRAARMDGQFDQEVAIKLVRVGMGSSFLVQRFLHERQILASLNHPHIARLLDGGATEDGVPYLVMELVDGERIDAYCESRKLSVTERLRLFLEVCGAVQYAHQRLVVHRDLKPSNILVTKEGEPKLLDFGIAKMLDPSADSETTMARPMTPEYASPEQIRGDAITTATDVYSLGVVLYQLLTGRNPYGPAAKSPHELSKAISESQPQRPSSAVTTGARFDQKNALASERAAKMTSLREPTPERLRRRLAGDVDNILMMALRKEPELRYGSVQQFADDIERHLNGLPVTAAKGSWSYLARKFAVRHRTGLAATALVIVALAAGIVATERQARIARMERARAQKRFDDVRQFSNALIFDVHDALASIPGTTAARSLLLDRAVQYLDSVSRDAEGDAELQRELARGYQRLATVQGDASVSNTGEVSAADKSIQKAIALYEAVAKENPRNVTDQLNLATMHRQKGISDVFYPDGRPELERALAITEPLMRDAGSNPRLLLERAIEEQGLALSHDVAGERTEAIDGFQKTLALVEQIARIDPGYRNLSIRIAKTRIQLGFEYAFTGEMDKALQLNKDGIAAYAALVAKNPEPDIARDLTVARTRLAVLSAINGDLATAGAQLRLVREALTPMQKADPGSITMRVDLMSLDFHEARLKALDGKFAEAAAQLDRTLNAFHKLHAEEDTGPGDGAMYAWLGEAQFGMHQPAQALESYQKAVKALESDVQYADGQAGIVMCYARVGDANAALGRMAEAEAAYSKALEKSAAIAPRAKQDFSTIYPIAAAHLGRAEMWMKESQSAKSPEERAKLRDQSCAAYRQSAELMAPIKAPQRFSPSEYPVADPRRSDRMRASCDAAAASPGH